MKNNRIYIVSHVYYNHYRMTDVLTASTDLDAVKDYICKIQYSGLIYTPEDSICITVQYLRD